MDMIFSVAKGIRHATMKLCSRATVCPAPTPHRIRYMGSPRPAHPAYPQHQACTAYQAASPIRRLAFRSPFGYCRGAGRLPAHPAL